MKIYKKRELQQMASTRLSDIEPYKEYSKEPYPFLVNDTPLSSDNPLRFRKNLL